VRRSMSRRWTAYAPQHHAAKDDGRLSTALRCQQAAEAQDTNTRPAAGEACAAAAEG
jgi:hypothetical protein